VYRASLPVALLWVWMIFDETPPLSTLVGGAITFTAVITYLALEFIHASRIRGAPCCSLIFSTL